MLIQTHANAEGQSADACPTLLALSARRARSVEIQAQFIADQLTGYGRLAWRHALAAEYSVAHALSVPTPSAFRSPFVRESIAASEGDFTAEQREDFARRLANLSALPRDWRLRATRAFLVAIGDEGSSTPPGLTPSVMNRVHEILDQIRDRVIGNFVPDATETEIVELKRLNTGFVVRKLPPG